MILVTLNVAGGKKKYCFFWKTLKGLKKKKQLTPVIFLPQPWLISLKPVSQTLIWVLMICIACHRDLIFIYLHFLMGSLLSLSLITAENHCLVPVHESRVLHQVSQSLSKGWVCDAKVILCGFPASSTCGQVRRSERHGVPHESRGVLSSCVGPLLRWPFLRFPLLTAVPLFSKWGMLLITDLSAAPGKNDCLWLFPFSTCMPSCIPSQPPYK